MILASVLALMGMVPDGEKLELHTESGRLAGEWEKRKGHAAAEFSGDLTWENIPHPWKLILEYLSKGTRDRGIDIKLKQELIPCYQEIMEEYVKEVIERDEMFHPDSTPNEAPWAQRERRRETARDSRGDSIERFETS
jgi:hypothetical protein